MKIRTSLYIYITLFGITVNFAQTENGTLEKQNDSTEIMYYIIKGDTVAREIINQKNGKEEKS